MAKRLRNEVADLSADVAAIAGASGGGGGALAPALLAGRWHDQRAGLPLGATAGQVLAAGATFYVPTYLPVAMSPAWIMARITSGAVGVRYGVYANADGGFAPGALLDDIQVGSSSGEAAANTDAAIDAGWAWLAIIIGAACTVDGWSSCPIALLGADGSSANGAHATPAWCYKATGTDYTTAFADDPTGLTPSAIGPRISLGDATIEP